MEKLKIEVELAKLIQVYIYIVLGYKESYKLELDISFLKMLIEINIIYIYLLGNKSEVSYISLIRIIRDPKD